MEQNRESLNRSHTHTHTHTEKTAGRIFNKLLTEVDYAVGKKSMG